jgi:hypothetical protein
MSRPFSATVWVLTDGAISWTGQVVNGTNGSSSNIMTSTDGTGLITVPTKSPTTDGGVFGLFSRFQQKSTSEV